MGHPMLLRLLILFNKALRTLHHQVVFPPPAPLTPLLPNGLPAPLPLAEPRPDLFRLHTSPLAEPRPDEYEPERIGEAPRAEAGLRAVVAPVRLPVGGASCASRLRSIRTDGWSLISMSHGRASESSSTSRPSTWKHGLDQRPRDAASTGWMTPTDRLTCTARACTCRRETHAHTDVRCMHVTT